MMNDGMFVVGFDPLELLNSDTKIKPDLLVKVSLSDKKTLTHQRIRFKNGRFISFLVMC